MRILKKGGGKTDRKKEGKQNRKKVHELYELGSQTVVGVFGVEYQ
jgi:hypothetical protein